MHKVFLISGLALALAGCAAQQGESGPVQVRDLSASRADATPGEYTVEAGDTLYGIAWRHDMDYRDLARLNRIGPPYRIEPGQRLVLVGEGSATSASSQDGDENASSGRGVVATGLGGEASGSDEELDWLMPDESAIERNRRLSAERQAAGDSPQGPTQAAMESADAVSGADQGPGPVYSYDSPGADGTLSERDLAERRELASRAEEDNAEEQQATGTAAAQSGSEPSDAPDATAEDEAAQVDRASSETDDGGTDAGTSVAGEPASEQRAGRSYTPVDEVPWQWPVEGDVVGQFGEGGTVTAGIDIAGQKGQPVKAAGPGIVVYAGSGVRGYGNLILLKHNDQFLSAYAHNDTLNVKENDVVEAGEVIATMGDSDAEDVRLHFEVRKDGQPQDPLEFLPAR
ncbi:peptidoglycan DD-metalloendopeptidase family protein [Halomonas rhizosphaerae]|uniref:Peptidoglycan DD-metalloendopeptidase family protein n=1 Tax=Halomonas rhizosphaerae TaxID=3043296 RepID=A0ABT6UY93_9GAMM|nr:peptidoglycan DD-metalloendopeptidase family protein [Halomonas rhizosphaerae]MDI5890948.1 peptidoglycan DD-metalloendopeptidase family protein [Halomonas rhizosphaerae]